MRKEEDQHFHPWKQVLKETEKVMSASMAVHLSFLLTAHSAFSDTAEVYITDILSL